MYARMCASVCSTRSAKPDTFLRARRTVRPQNYSPVKLGVLLPNWAGPFREEVTRGIESARVKLSGRHAEIRVCTCETDIPGEAITLLDELVDWGAQGIALCALNDITIEAKVG